MIAYRPGTIAINDVIRHRRIAVFGHIARLLDSTQHIKRYSPTSTSHSVVFPIPPGVVGLVAHVADGSTKSETTPARHLRPLETGPWTQSSWTSDATALHAGYAMMMMMMMITINIIVLILLSSVV